MTRVWLSNEFSLRGKRCSRNYHCDSGLQVTFCTTGMIMGNGERLTLLVTSRTSCCKISAVEPLTRVTWWLLTAPEKVTLAMSSRPRPTETVRGWIMKYYLNRGIIKYNYYITYNPAQIYLVMLMSDWYLGCTISYSSDCSRETDVAFTKLVFGPGVLEQLVRRWLSDIFFRGSV